MKTTFHFDGTVSYWSVYGQCWIRRAQSVPDRELAAMAPSERERVRRHFERAAIETEALLASAVQS